jgi:hypothetical protein
MKVVTVHGTWEIDLEKMQVSVSDSCRVLGIKKVPTPVRGERMEIETVQGTLSTEQVVYIDHT